MVLCLTLGVMFAVMPINAVAGNDDSSALNIQDQWPLLNGYYFRSASGEIIHFFVSGGGAQCIDFGDSSCVISANYNYTMDEEGNYVLVGNDPDTENVIISIKGSDVSINYNGEDYKCVTIDECWRLIEGKRYESEKGGFIEFKLNDADVPAPIAVFGSGAKDVMFLELCSFSVGKDQYTFQNDEHRLAFLVENGAIVMLGFDNTLYELSSAPHVEPTEDKPKPEFPTETVTTSKEELKEGVSVTEAFKSADEKTEDTGVEITIGNSGEGEKSGSIVFSPEAIAQIVASLGTSEANLKVEIETDVSKIETSGKIDEATAKEVKLVVELDLGGVEFSNGAAEINLPFTEEVPTGYCVVIYYVDKDGNKTALDTEYKDGMVSFATTHFSTYIALIEEAPVNKDGLSAGAIVGIVVGSVVGVALICYALGYFCLYRKGKLDGKKIEVIYSFLPEGKQEQ